MDRVTKSNEVYEKLFGETMPAFYETDPEFQEILNRFILGDVFCQGELQKKKRELLTLAILTVNQTIPQLKAHVGSALRVRAKAIEIKETIYQCAPYIGFPKTLNAIQAANEVFKEKGIDLPLESCSQVDEETRFEKGLKAQTDIFGDVIKKNYENVPDNQKHIQIYLSEMCFGDFYTRKGLDIKTRELLTLCILSAQGGCENQIKAHVQGNLNVGNEKDLLITAVTHCMPYIGFPRTINALACINEIIPE